MTRDLKDLSGNSSQVFTDGESVYRDLKVHSKSVHRLLKHLENKQCLFVPHLLESKGQRERLSFVKGQTISDYPETNSIEDQVKTVQSAVRLLRRYHDATLDFVVSDQDDYFLTYSGELKTSVMCHNDFAPYNVTFENNRVIGIIDFDTICPGPGIWDVAYAVYRFVPLSHQVYEVSTSCYRTYTKLDGVVRKRLLGEFLRSYGELEEVDLFPIIIARLTSLVTLFDSESQKGNQALIKMKEDGHQSFYLKEIEFIKKNCHDWH